MRVHLDWETAYRFSEPVRQLHTELRVVPRDRPSQRIDGSELRLDPAGRVATFTDAFGNLVSHVDFLQPVDRLTVGLITVVETLGGGEPEPELPPLTAHLFRRPTRRAPVTAPIAALAERLDAGSALATAHAAMRHVHEEFRYEVGVTDVGQTAEDLLELGHGVCQDFTHLVIALLRVRGYAARYVSGYLAPPSGTETSVASHAWPQVWDGGTWYGVDPVSGAPQDELYVVTAVGRDYDDVAPLRGTFRGTATQEWETRVHLGRGTAQAEPGARRGAQT